VKLNVVETLLVNNPVRDLLMRRSVAWLHAAAGGATVGRALEVGCGQGSGIREIARRLRPPAIDGFDLDERQVARARAHVAALDGVPVRLWVGDAERIAAPAAAYDAVCEFAILHHVPGWRRALAEIRRVLRPGGRFFFEELSIEFFRDVPLVSPFLRRFTVHPWDTMFDFPTFRRALDDVGLRVTALRAPFVPGWHWGVAVRA